jgi:hypothetical protein
LVSSNWPLTRKKTRKKPLQLKGCKGLVSLSKNWCRDQESNQGHTDFQSVALPTELSRRLIWRGIFNRLRLECQQIFLIYYHFIALSLFIRLYVWTNLRDRGQNSDLHPCPWSLLPHHSLQTKRLKNQYHLKRALFLEQAQVKVLP